MCIHCFSLTRALLLSCLLLMGSAARADSDEYLLIRQHLQIQRITLVEINEQSLVHLENDRWMTVDLDQCIALLATDAKPRSHVGGVLILTDGQRFPGKPVAHPARRDDEFMWSHPWLGQIVVPLQSIEAVLFGPALRPPEPGDTDVLLLANGDRFEGFLVSLGDPVVIEIETESGEELVDIPRANVEAVRMVAHRTPPSGRRVWFRDGTVMDVTSLLIGDDGLLRLTSRWHSAGTKPALIERAQFDALLLDPRRLLPLANLSPDRIEGPTTRFLIPEPVKLQPDASLQLSPLELSGPILVRYSLPAGCTRFAAQAMIPDEARHWADFELIIRGSDEVLFTQRMNAIHPRADINVPLRGSELTIELTEGANGSIQDRLILNLPMLLIEPR